MNYAVFMGPLTPKKLNDKTIAFYFEDGKKKIIFPTKLVERHKQQTTE